MQLLSQSETERELKAELRHKVSVQEAFEKTLRSASVESMESAKRPRSVKVIREGSSLLRPTRSQEQRLKVARKEERKRPTDSPKSRYMVRTGQTGSLQKLRTYDSLQEAKDQRIVDKHARRIANRYSASSKEKPDSKKSLRSRRPLSTDGSAPIFIVQNASGAGSRRTSHEPPLSIDSPLTRLNENLRNFESQLNVVAANLDMVPPPN